MSTPLTILFAGGGTGGHLYPGIAVAESLRSIMPEAKPLFLCTERAIDRIILEPTGFEFIPQPIVPPDRSMSGLLRFWSSWRATKELVRQVRRQRKPDLVLGLGGYAAGVAVKVAATRNIPTALINPDVIPGKANQYLMRFVRTIFCQFEQTREHVSPIHRQKLIATGCPIRSTLRQLPPREEAAKRLELEPNVNTLVITGASQGAKTVNEAMIETLSRIKPQGWQILHLAGREQGVAVRDAYRERGLAARVIDFTADMEDVWSVADLAVSRAGASSCAELTACGVPSVLMPYPFHRDKHQRINAQVLDAAGAAVLMDDERDPKKNAAKLRPILESLLFDGAKRKQMADAARVLGHPDAADRVATALAERIGKATPDAD